MPPVTPKGPGPFVQGPNKAPPTPEELKAMREAAETLARDEAEPAPETAETPEEQPPQAESASETAPSRRPDLGDAQRGRPQVSREKISTYLESQANRLPENIQGHKINTNPLVARQQGDGKSAPENAARNVLERGDAAFSRGTERPFPRHPSPQQMKSLMKDPVFRGPLRDSPLHQKLQPRSLEQERHLELEREIPHRSEHERLTRGEVGQLFSLRHKFEKKDEGKSLLRHELARLREEKKQKVNALKQQTERNSQKEDAKALQKSRESRQIRDDAAKEQLAFKLKHSSSESDFERTLQRMLAGEDPVPELPESVRARFAAKSEAEWDDFFAKLLKLSSAEIESSAQLEKLMEALYRGQYKRGADGKALLVSDLFLTENGEIAEHKFSRIAVADSELWEMLSKLKPGDTIGKELLKKLGEEFLFLKLVHVVDQLPVTDEQKAAILREFRQQVSPSSRQNIERALEQKRRKGTLPEENVPNPAAAYAGDQFNKKERHPGPPKFFMYMIYGVIAVAVVMILAILLRQI